MSLLFRQTAPSIRCYYGDVISIGDIIDTMVGYHNRPNHHNYHYLTQRNIHNAINIASVPVCSQHAHDGLCGGANGVELYTGEACEAIILLFLSFCPSLCLRFVSVCLSVCLPVLSFYGRLYGCLIRSSAPFSLSSFALSRLFSLPVILLRYLLFASSSLPLPFVFLSLPLTHTPPKGLQVSK